MADILDIQYSTLIELLGSVPFLPQQKWIADKALSGSIEYSIQKFEIPANQSADFTMPIQTITGTFLTFIYNPDKKTRVGGATVSLKINGGQSSLLAPRRALSEDVTALTGTNTSTTTIMDVIVAKFYNNGTVNFVEN